MDLNTIKNDTDRMQIAAGDYAAKGNPGAADGFNLLYYLTRYPDIKNAGVGGEYHYNNFGKAEGRYPNQAAELAANPQHNPVVPVETTSLGTSGGGGGSSSDNSTINNLLSNISSITSGLQNNLAAGAGAQGSGAGAPAADSGSKMKMGLIIGGVIVALVFVGLLIKKLM